MVCTGMHTNMQLLVKRLSVALMVKDAQERGLMDRSSLTTAVCYVAHSRSSPPAVTAANALVCVFTMQNT